jgi:hypothetical protein
MHHQTKEIQETMLHHQCLIWALAFHKEEHPKFHNLQTTKTQKNSKNIKKQNTTPLKWALAFHEEQHPQFHNLQTTKTQKIAKNQEAKCNSSKVDASIP